MRHREEGAEAVTDPVAPQVGALRAERVQAGAPDGGRGERADEQRAEGRRRREAVRSSGRLAGAGGPDTTSSGSLIAPPAAQGPFSMPETYVEQRFYRKVRR